MAVAVDHVVVDSGAFIRNAPIKDIGKTIYTLTDVIREIRDKSTRERLQVLPYELELQEPDPKHIQIVTEFTKKTGDYASLSATDIKVIALTYQLELKYVGGSHIRTVPEKKVEIKHGGNITGTTTEIAGFYVKDDKSPSEDAGQAELNQITSDLSEKLTTEETVTSDTDQSKTSLLSEGDVIHEEITEYDSSGSESDGAEGEEYEDDDDDDEGWITPQNIDEVNIKMTGAEKLESAQCVVGCLTTDFAIQNVLIQMGLKVLSVDGLLIKKAKSYVLRCFSCHKITTNMAKEFCYFCGNRTLRKLSVAVNEDGTLQYFLSRRLPRIYKEPSLPLPKGGKYSNYPKLTEDQKMPQRRMAKQREAHYGVFDPDFVANASPFAIRDTNSRAAHLGVGKNFNKRNPFSGSRRKRV